MTPFGLFFLALCGLVWVGLYAGPVAVTALYALVGLLLAEAYYWFYPERIVERGRNYLIILTSWIVLFLFMKKTPESSK